jgi:RNA polymerase-binding transcription factor DksA
MSATTDSRISQDLDRLLNSVDIPLNIDVEDGVVTLGGLVYSEEERQAALDLANALPGVTGVIDDLEIAVMDLDDPNALLNDASDGTDFGEPDIDPETAVEEGQPYFPPVDPPIAVGEGPDAAAVAAGFSGSALDEPATGAPIELPLDVLDDAEDLVLADIDIVDAVAQELAEDATTSHLDLTVQALGRTVFVSGFVDDDLDSENAVAVAERVEGVDEVVDQTMSRRRSDSGAVERREPIPAEPPPPQQPPSRAWRITVAANQLKLRRMREETEARIAAIEEDIASFGLDQKQEGLTPNHDADLATDVSTSETLQAELANLRQTLDDIEDALRAAEQGRYGIDVDTGAYIDPERLRVLPFAKRTLASQERFEARANGRPGAR